MEGKTLAQMAEEYAEKRWKNIVQDEPPHKPVVAEKIFSKEDFLAGYAAAKDKIEKQILNCRPSVFSEWERDAILKIIREA